MNSCFGPVHCCEPQTNCLKRILGTVLLRSKEGMQKDDAVSGKRSKGKKRRDDKKKKRKKGASSACNVTGASGLTKREQLVKELLMSERVHVEGLNIFVNEYVIPLRDKKLLTPDELHDLLCNLELIRNWHVQFLQQLESLIEDDCGFGELFLEMVPVLLVSLCSLCI